MPEWNFFAFDSVAVAKSMLIPTQEAVRNHDLTGWHKMFDLLSATHLRPHVWGNGLCYIPPYTLVTDLPSQNAISRDVIPDETNFGLRRTLQTFVELISQHFVVSRRTKL